MAAGSGEIVYVVGAGFSAGLGFPTIRGLLPVIWPQLISAGIDASLADIIRFHHPSFNPSRPDTFINVETLLSEMEANEELFDSSRPATGRFTVDELIRRRQSFLLEVAAWFHELQRNALAKPPKWLSNLAGRMRAERAQIISFNWDLVLDELLFGDALSRQNYGFTASRKGPRLLKPHGSLNWYEQSSGRHLRSAKKFRLAGAGADAVYAFRPYRAPTSARRTYMPLIVPPVFNKRFSGPVFQLLWRKAVSVLSTASEVHFLGYSLADADFHARFIFAVWIPQSGEREAANGRQAQRPDWTRGRHDRGRQRCSWRSHPGNGRLARRSKEHDHPGMGGELALMSLFAPTAAGGKQPEVLTQAVSSLRPQRAKQALLRPGLAPDNLELR